MHSLSLDGVLAIAVAGALLAACGGSQQPIGGPGAMPQTRAIATRAAHAGSLMLPEARSKDLLYVSDAGTNEVYVFSYPRGRYIGMLVGLIREPHGVCSDKAGNVFVTEFGIDNNYVQEYAHGGNSAIATLSAPGEPEECSSDPTTGNLAVAIYSYSSAPSGVAIYANAQGNPTMYTDSSLQQVTACSYDDHGDLFAAGANSSQGFELAELPAGTETFENIALKSKIDGKFFEPIQWDNQYLAIGSHAGAYSKEYSIKHVAISGATGTVVRRTRLLLKQGYFSGDTAFSIWRHMIVLTYSPEYPKGGVGFWTYPRGSIPLRVTRDFGSQYLDGVTVSTAPK
jgi:hypothetical protein